MKQTKKRKNLIGEAQKRLKNVMGEVQKRGKKLGVKFTSRFVGRADRKTKKMFSES